ncbi:Uncharacterised protein [Yersinia enterocolitica]|nr:Uncharacterised protein [Yersinia enterocolitica]
MLDEKDEDWGECLSVALQRQSKYFDAVLPEKLLDIELQIAHQTANNLVKSIKFINNQRGNSPIIKSPLVPGYQWIAQGYGDFAIGNTLIEVKCSSRNFSSSDYRQILIYWLLSYSSSIEGRTAEWNTGILLNPRANKHIEISFHELVKIAGAGRTKLELLELFSSIVGDYAYKLSN